MHVICLASTSSLCLGAAVRQSLKRQAQDVLPPGDGVMEKISASFVFSAAENVSALSARGAVSVAPGSKKQL